MPMPFVFDSIFLNPTRYYITDLYEIKLETKKNARQNVFPSGTVVLIGCNNKVGNSNGLQPKYVTP